MVPGFLCNHDREPGAMPKNPLRTILLSFCGLLAVTLGVVGIVVPLLPTTPFLLLAAACFLRSSDRLYRWLTNHRWFGPYIRNYREHRALPLRTKVFTLVLLWAALGYAMIAVTEALLLRIVLGIIGIGVTVHILRFRTLTAGMLLEAAEPAPARPDNSSSQKDS